MGRKAGLCVQKTGTANAVPVGVCMDANYFFCCFFSQFLPSTKRATMKLAT